MSTAEVAGEVHRVLAGAGIAHAFGGALALNYYAQPRLTADVDVNVAVSVADAGDVLELFERRGFAVDAPEDSTQAPAAGVRLRRGRDTLDLFFVFDPYLEHVVEVAATYRFSTGDEVLDLPFLTANDLVVMKVSFNRPRDWADIEAMLASGTPIDADYVGDRLVAFRGPTMHPRVVVLRQRIAHWEDLASPNGG